MPTPAFTLLKMPYLEEHQFPVLRVLTDRTTEY